MQFGLPHCALKSKTCFRYSSSTPIRLQAKKGGVKCSRYKYTFLVCHIMTIVKIRGNFGNLDENRPPQAVEICVFTFFSSLPGVASPFDNGIIYILNENRVFSCSLLETSTISATRTRRTLTSAAGPCLSHRFATWSIV